MKYEIYIQEPKKSQKFCKKAIAEYEKRLSRYCKISCKFVKKEKEWNSLLTKDTGMKKLLVHPRWQTGKKSSGRHRKCSGNRWNGKSSRNCIYHKGVPGERNTAIKRLFNTEITERNTILPLKWKSYKQTAR